MDPERIKRQKAERRQSVKKRRSEESDPLCTVMSEYTDCEKQENESVDSGCVADGPSDIGSELQKIDWSEVTKSLAEECKYITDLLNFLPHNGPIPYSNYQYADLKNSNWSKRTDTNCAERRKNTKDPKIRKQQRKEKLRKQRLLRKSKSKIPKAISSSSSNIKAENKQEPSSSKMSSNPSDNLIFSKFDFSKNKSVFDPNAKKKPDVKALLAKTIKEKEKLKDMERKGKSEKAAELKNSKAWEAAFKKATGEKVKDDVDLLKKSVKRLEYRKVASKRKWEQRQARVEKAKESRQEKRQHNVQARKDQKLNKKMKKLKKKGHVVPGF